MVVLKDLFRLLATGEFSNIALSRTDTGSIAEKEYEKVINHINMGVQEIYKRFKFLENEIVLHADPVVGTYYLRPERMALSHNINTKIYVEQPNDMEGCLNIVEVMAVFDELGKEMPINNRFEMPSIIFTSEDTVKIAKLDIAQPFTIVYQAFPTEIIIEDNFDPSEIVLPIPKIVINPLLYYIAAAVYKPMGSNDSTANADKSAGYEQQYELAMQKIDMYGLNPKNMDDENKFLQEGWA